MSNKTRIAWTIDEWFILKELIEVPIKKFEMQSLKNMIDNPSVRNTMLKWEWGPLLRSETENKKYSICVERIGLRKIEFLESNLKKEDFYKVSLTKKIDPSCIKSSFLAGHRRRQAL